MENILATVPLHRDQARTADRTILEAGGLSASLFLTPYGIEALRLCNPRGELVVLPWFGQMIWSMRFDGVDCTMASGFDAPRPASNIAGTYGCFAFHSGLLRNGVPGPEDDHPAHGEFPCAQMRDARLELLDIGDRGPAIRVVSTRDHVEGFGPHYLATPSVTLAAHAALATIAMKVRNMSGRPMDLMYMCHVNWAFVAGGRILQQAPFTPERTRVRRSVPRHVIPDRDYLDTIEALAEDPGRARILDGGLSFDPEQVFYIDGLAEDAEGLTTLMLRRPDGDAFAVRYAPASLPHCVRWLFDDPDQKVAGFALPATCEPEGYTAERRKGHVRVLAPGETAQFAVEVAHLDLAEAGQWEGLMTA